MLNLCVLPVNRHWYNKLQDASRLTSTSKHPNTHVLLSFEDCVLERNELVHYGIFIAAKHRFPKDYLHGIFFFFFFILSLKVSTVIFFVSVYVPLWECF